MEIWDIPLWEITMTIGSGIAAILGNMELHGRSVDQTKPKVSVIFLHWVYTGHPCARQSSLENKKDVWLMDYNPRYPTLPYPLNRHSYRVGQSGLGRHPQIIEDSGLSPLLAS